MSVIKNLAILAVFLCIFLKVVFPIEYEVRKIVTKKVYRIESLKDNLALTALCCGENSLSNVKLAKYDDSNNAQKWEPNTCRNKCCLSKLMHIPTFTFRPLNYSQNIFSMSFVLYNLGDKEKNYLQMNAWKPIKIEKDAEEPIWIIRNDTTMHSDTCLTNLNRDGKIGVETCDMTFIDTYQQWKFTELII